MKTLFTLLLTFLSCTTFAQSNFVKGYYVTQKGDTVQTFIDDQNWDKNPEFIHVRPDITSTSDKKLTVKDIKGFTLSTGDVYEVYSVDVDKTPSKLNELEANAAPVIVTDTVFLWALVKGKVSLYYLKDENAKPHFYLKKSLDKPEELIYRHEKLKVNEQVVYRRPEIYKGLLSLYFSDCEAVKARVGKVQYRMSALISITNEYNVCSTGSASEYMVANEKPELHFGVLGGAAQSSLVFSGENYEELAKSSFTDLSYTFGVSMDVVLPRAHGKFSVRNELMYKPFTAEDTYTKRVFPDRDKNYTVYNTYFDMANVGLNTMVRWRLFNGTFKPFVQIGMANNYLLRFTTSQDREIHYYDIQRKESHVPLDDIRRYSQSFIGSAGFSVKNFSAEFRAESGNSISNYPSLRSVYNSFSLLLGYRIK